MNGIDISQWQGDMDLTPYKDGFVIIRGGFWTSADPWAERNIAKCEKLGIPWGLYWYSYALKEAQARQEAEACLKFLAGRKPRLGVWFDMEDADGYKAQEVLDGKWGNGEERKQKLGAWFYDLVQDEVNRMLGV